MSEKIDLHADWTELDGVKSQHLRNEKDGLTLWVSHGGLLGHNEMVLNLFVEQADELYPIPLSVVQLACDSTNAPSRIIRWMTAGEKGEFDKRMKAVRLGTITDCALALCSYCKASAESGQTTEHNCIAKPLYELFQETAKEMWDE